MSDCIFCRIINGEIPSYKVYEDDKVYAFLDLSQTTKGHTLVVPKVHKENIFEYNEALAADVFSRIPKIARAMKEALPDMEGINIVNNNGEVAGQTVFHSHIHLIPRYSANDEFSISFPDHASQTDEKSMSTLAEKIGGEI